MTRTKKLLIILIIVLLGAGAFLAYRYNLLSFLKNKFFALRPNPSPTPVWNIQKVIESKVALIKYEKINFPEINSLRPIDRKQLPKEITDLILFNFAARTGKIIYKDGKTGFWLDYQMPNILPVDALEFYKKNLIPAWRIIGQIGSQYFSFIEAENAQYKLRVGIESVGTSTSKVSIQIIAK